MGFDLVAKNKGRGDKGYFHASAYQMILLRASMIAAGVDEKLVYGKFVGNDGLLVTTLQSLKIAESMAAWLGGRKLAVVLSEGHASAKATNEAYFGIIRAIGGRDDRRALKQFQALKSRPLRLDPKSRKFLRRFAEFAGHSGGFWVS